MCFNLEKDKTEALQESKWSLKPRALYINNVVSLEKKRKKKGKKPTSSKQKPKAWPFSYFQVKSRGQHTVVLYMDIYSIYPYISRIDNYNGFFQKYFLCLSERANVQSLQTGGSRNVLMLHSVRISAVVYTPEITSEEQFCLWNCTTYSMKQLLFHCKTVFEILIYFPWHFFMLCCDGVSYRVTWWKAQGRFMRFFYHVLMIDWYNWQRSHIRESQCYW